MAITRSDLGSPALRAFFNIAARWSLDEQQQARILGIESPSCLQSWKEKLERQEPVALSRDTLERISYVLGIYKAVNTLLPVSHRADRWIHASNSAPLFGGRSALDKMIAGNVSDLFEVRRYLDAQLA